MSDLRQGVRSPGGVYDRVSQVFERVNEPRVPVEDGLVDVHDGPCRPQSHPEVQSGRGICGVVRGYWREGASFILLGGGEK